jgi:hypothetical protein
VLLKSVKSRTDEVGGGEPLASMTVGAALAKRAMEEMAEARVVKETISLESNDVVWKFVEKYLERWSWIAGIEGMCSMWELKSGVLVNDTISWEM